VDALIEPMLGRVDDDAPRRRRAAGPEEQRLAAALRAGDRDAVATVEARFGRLLSGFLRDALPDPASAEDVLQQVLLEIWRRGPDYDPDRAGLVTWMMTIARSRAIDERRRRRPEPIDPAVVVERAGSSSGEVDRLLERWRLAALLDRIPSEEAVALRLRFYEELAQPEIAERMGIPLGTVKTRMVRGLARLRGLILEEEGDDGQA
jgi:RNA polymerase sigma-70 factor, ECF subfamily